MFIALIILALLYLPIPLSAARAFTMGDDDAPQCSQSEVVSHSVISAAEAESVGRLAVTAGTAGTSETSVTIANGTAEIICFWYEGAPAEADWANAVNWDIRLDVTTAADANWTATELFRVSSDCSTKISVIETTSHSISLNSTGVTADVSLVGTSQSGAGDTDLFLFVLSCTENVAHGNAAFGVTPNQDIDTPLDALGSTRTRAHSSVTGD